MTQPVPAGATATATAYVRGAKFGNAMHAVFEHREHGRPLSQQVAFVSVQLLNEGVRAGDGRADLVPTLAARVDAALAADLGGGMRLNDVAADAQRAEMAFTIQLSVLQLQAMAPQRPAPPCSAMALPATPFGSLPERPWDRY